MVPDLTPGPAPETPEIVSDPIREYEAARCGVVIIAEPGRRLLSVRGRDALGFLHGMLTQDVLGMAPGETRPACQTDRKGHLLADIYLRRLDDGGWIDAPAEQLALLEALYEKHRIMEQLQIEPMKDLEAIFIGGPGSPALLERIEEVGWPVRETAAPGFRLWPSDAPDLVERALAAGAEPIGGRTLERLRIEAGRPRFGRDMNETHFPQEVGLEDAIHTSKGCYLGQETLARLRFRGHVNRSLYGVRIPGAPPAAGAEVKIDGEVVAFLSSVAGPPGSGDSLGLLLLRVDRQAEGRSVVVEGRQGFLESLPFREGRID
jgi:folate-binding protein YgfZ